jgi:hypothetical protein
MDVRVVGVRFPAGATDFSLPYSVQTGSGALPASYPMGTRALSPGIKRPKRDDHSNPVPKLRMVDLYLHSPYAFMVWCSTGARSRAYGNPTLVSRTNDDRALLRARTNRVHSQRIQCNANGYWSLEDSSAASSAGTTTPSAGHSFVGIGR